MNSVKNEDFKPTVSMKNFRFWCQKVLPLVYDDSISYYEVLGKMVVYLNQVIDNVNADIDNVNTLKEAFIALQEYVAEAIQYDISDLQEAVATAVHSAEMASESATLASGSATSAQESASSALTSAQQASGSAINASNSAINAIEAQQQASGYASDANNSALNAANSALNTITMATQASEYAERAENAKTSAESASSSASQSADNAEHFKNETNTDALKAEGFAVGKQNNVDVIEGSPYWHNNAAYYADQAGTSSGVHPTLTGLEDTEISNPSNGQALVYDSTAQKWVNSDEAIGVTSLDALTDTDIQSPSSGQVLMYNGTEWENSAEKEVAISQNPPSDPATKIWIDETQQTPIEIPTMSDLNGAIGNIDEDIADINTAITVINTTLNNKANSTDVNNALVGKENKATIVSLVDPASISLNDNYEYYVTSVNTLNITYPSGNFECWMIIQTASSGAISITFPASNYIGNQPEFSNGELWEISIKNGIIIAGKVE